MKSLRNLVLSTYPYEQLRDLCFEEESNFGEIFDCHWDLWRDKAVAEFNITPQFFDLVKTLSGPQRYLSIKSYFAITKDLAVRLYPNGYIEGVYESVIGFLVAEDRLDIEMCKFFYNRLTEKQKEAVASESFMAELFSQGMFNPSREVLLENYGALRFLTLGLMNLQEYLSHFDETKKWRSLEDALERGNEEALYYILQQQPDERFFLSALRSGRTDFVDALLHQYIAVPQGFSIAKNVPKVHFWQSPVRVPLPKEYFLPEGKETMERFRAVVWGCNTQVLDFFLSLYNLSDDYLNFIPYLELNYNVYSDGEPAINPEKKYEMYVRVPIQTTFRDMEITLAGLKEDEYDWREVYILRAFGYITTVQSILALERKNKPRLIFISERLESISYPLSILLAQEYYSILIE